jgi:hypothetical protein
VPYACHKCGSTIEEGTAFCPHCGAPQIRVAVPETATVLAPSASPQTQPAAEPLSIQPSDFQGVHSDVEWRASLSTLAIAGLLTGLASWLPLGVLWCIPGGAMAVVLYRKRFRFAGPLTSRSGAKVGAASGLIGYLVFAVIAAIDFSRPGSMVRDTLMNALQQAASRNSDPATQEMYRKMVSPEGMAVVVTFLMALLFALFLGFGAIGGAIGASLTRRNRG